MAGRRSVSNPLSNQATPVLSQSELVEQGATEEEYEVLASNAEEETPTEPIGIPISALPGADTPTGDDAIPGVQADETVQYALSDLLAWIISQIAPADIGAVDAADVGVADGVASLDSDGKVPSSQLPTMPSNVEANPSGEATDTLTKLQVDQTIYAVSGGGVDYLTVVNGQICVIYEVTP